MVTVGQHEMIDLMTLSEVLEIGGLAGRYRVKIRKHARRVDSTMCTACNTCVDWCPVSVPSEFDQGISMRKAIYMPFPQAVPNTYLVDAASCTWVQSNGKKCGACVRKCAKQCIHLEEQDETVEVEVGNIVVATGYDTFDARRIERYGYGRFPNVLTALEFERLTNASGPTGGRIVLKSERRDKKKEAVLGFHADGPQPRSVAIIHCVGSRDRNHNEYCSRVCCMVSLKFAHLVREKLPDARIYEFYIDMRAFGKGYEEFFERIRSEGVHIVRGRSARVEARGDAMVLRGEDIVSDRVVEFPVDMVILAVGMQPHADAAGLAARAGIERDEDGWLREWNYNTEPTSTERGGIHVAGVCQGPKDIPDTVAQAAAVAAKVLRSLVIGKGEGGRRELSLEDIEARAAALSAILT
jgi:heterodisulfide reductase subunit A